MAPKLLVAKLSKKEVQRSCIDELSLLIKDEPRNHNRN